MDQHGLVAATRSLTSAPSRRDILRGLAGAGLGLGIASIPPIAGAKKKGKPKPKSTKGMCARNGSRCRKKGKTCKRTFCLRAPFTVEAIWSLTATHDTYLFVPPRDEPTGYPAYITIDCKQSNSLCKTEHPFACIDEEAYQVGDEVTTIHRLLPGTYEYWISLATTSAGEVTVVLKDRGGRVVRQWQNPANPSSNEAVGWHVFDVDGTNGRVAAIDLTQDYPTAYADVCPKIA